MDYDNEINIDYKIGYEELKRHMTASCNLLECTFEYLYASIQEMQKENYILQGKVEALNDVIRRNM